MKKYRNWALVAVPVALLTLVFSLYFFNRKPLGVVEGTLVDGLSQGPVWNATIILDGRSTVKFLGTEFKLSKIAPGDYHIKVSAPNYLDIEKAISVKRGRNVVDMAMESTGIPDLAGILAFAEPLEKGLRVEIRFTDQKGVAITNHPAIKCRLEVVLYLREGIEAPFTKSRKIFEGPLDVLWDAKDSLARYKGIISWDEMKVKPDRNHFGILEAKLITSQGTFTFTNDEIEFSQKVM